MKQCSFFPVHELTYPTKALGPIQMDEAEYIAPDKFSPELGEIFFFYQWEDIGSEEFKAFELFTAEYSNQALYGWKHPSDDRPRTVVLSDLKVVESTVHTPRGAFCRYDITMVAFIIGGDQENAPKNNQ